MSEEKKGQQRETVTAEEEKAEERQNERTAELAAERQNEQTAELATERQADPGPGALDATAAQVDAANANGEKKTPAREAKSGGTEGKAAKEGKGEKPQEPSPKQPSPKQPYLDQLVQKVKQKVGEEAIEEAYVNELSRHLPTLVVKKEHWPEVARCLKEETSLAFDLLLDVVGVDYADHMEVVYQLTSLEHNEQLGVKVKTEREPASVPSVTSVWAGADWPEREAYDLLGIEFVGHPDLRRILLPDDWVGHPLRKDYEPYDLEV